MSKIKYNLGIIFAIMLIAAGVIYIYFAHYAPLKPEHDTAISVWYVNDDAMWQNFSRTVNEYNSDEGARYGITVKTKAFASQAEMYDKICNLIEDGGELPNLTICDTDFAAYMDKKGVLTNLDSYIRGWEISAINSDMVKAATVGERLTAVPIASETNVFMVNTDMFSDADAMSTFEKLCSTADEYYGRTGNSFFTITDYSLFFRIASAQLHDEFDAVSPHDSDNKNSKYIYNLLAESAYNRGFSAVGADAAKQVADGKLACAIVSSADVMKYAEYIDSDSIEFMKYPCMKDGESVYVEQVTGAAVSKADEDAERASAMFLKWFVSEKVNSRFVGDSGYTQAIGVISNESDYAVYGKLMDAVGELENNGEKCIYSASADYSENSRNFVNVMNAIMCSLS